MKLDPCDSEAIQLLEHLVAEIAATPHLNEDNHLTSAASLEPSEDHESLHRIAFFAQRTLQTLRAASTLWRLMTGYKTQRRRGIPIENLGDLNSTLGNALLSIEKISASLREAHVTTKILLLTSRGRTAAFSQKLHDALILTQRFIVRLRCLLLEVRAEG